MLIQNRRDTIVVIALMAVITLAALVFSQEPAYKIDGLITERAEFGEFRDDMDTLEICFWFKANNSQPTGELATFWVNAAEMLRDKSGLIVVDYKVQLYSLIDRSWVRTDVFNSEWAFLSFSIGYKDKVESITYRNCEVVHRDPVPELYDWKDVSYGNKYYPKKGCHYIRVGSNKFQLRDFKVFTRHLTDKERRNIMNPPVQVLRPTVRQSAQVSFQDKVFLLNGKSLPSRTTNNNIKLVVKGGDPCVIYQFR